MKQFMVLLALCLTWQISLNGQTTTGTRSTPVIRKKTTEKSRVVVFENPNFINNYHVNNELLANNFNDAFLTFTQKSNLKEAWSQFVVPSDVVAIHISTTGGQILSTHRGLIQAVVQGLLSAGVQENNILVWDKFGNEMQNAGYAPNSSNNPFHCYSVVPGVGFDPDKFYFGDIAGQLIWGDHDFRGKPFPATQTLENLNDLAKSSTTTGTANAKSAEPQQVSNHSYFNNIVTKRATKIINIPVMSNDERIGMNGCIASLALASVDNTRRFFNSSDSSSEALAEIFGNEILQSKTVLHIMDGSIAQYAGGPYFTPYYSAQPGLIYISKDAAAIDTLALERIEAWRKTRAIDPIGDDANHIKFCVENGIGTNDKSKMEIITLK